jgi:hypothetical protein
MGTVFLELQTSPFHSFYTVVSLCAHRPSAPFVFSTSRSKFVMTILMMGFVAPMQRRIFDEDDLSTVFGDAVAVFVVVVVFDSPADFDCKHVAPVSADQG